MDVYQPVKTRLILFGLIFLLSISGYAYGGEPEYMSLGIEVGKAYEVKGFYKNSQFIATDIELLPKPRKPKIRGLIDKIDLSANTISVFGQTIQITDKTEFIDDKPNNVSISSLKVNQMIQVTCRVKDDGTWKATKIKVRDVKKSHKIKGTVTKVSIDGKAPDSIDISGLLIILNDNTDVNDATSNHYRVEKYLFGDLRNSSVYGISDGYLINEYLKGEMKYRQNWLSQKEYDLSTTFNANEDDSEHDIRGELTAIYDRSHAAYLQVRLRKRYRLTSEQNLPDKKLEAAITQLYYLWHNIENTGFSFSIGRQNFEEPREWLFDDYMDAIRLYYYGQENVLLEAAYITAVNPIKDKFDTWTDLFGQISYYLDPANKLSAYILKRSDTSLRNREPQWLGFRYIGNNPIIKSWVELSFIRGEDKGEDSKGYAYDIGATFYDNTLTYKPSVTIGYAFGSGDDPATPLVNERFRQSGYQDNVSTFNGMSSIYYYGALLDPELSNLKIMSFGFGFYPTKTISLDIVYHSYRQEYPDDDVKGSDLLDPPARPNGFSDEIGNGFDIIAAFPVVYDIVEPTLLVSRFMPGSAFEPYQENATYLKLNLNFII